MAPTEVRAVRFGLPTKQSRQASKAGKAAWAKRSGNCPICGVFVSGMVYCSDECRKERARRVTKAWLEKKKESPDYDEFSERNRKRRKDRWLKLKSASFVCRVCGKKNAKGVWCSAKCKNMTAKLTKNQGRQAWRMNKDNPEWLEKYRAKRRERYHRKKLNELWSSIINNNHQ